MAVSQRKQKKNRQRRQRRPAISRRRNAFEPDDVDVVRLLECKITREPMSDPLIDAMPPEDRHRFDELGELVHEQCGDLVEELEHFQEKYPNVPIIYNYLTAVYQAAGRSEEAERLIEETYQRFPDYLFALTNYVSLRLTQNRMDEVEAVLDGRLHICMMYAHRRCFHISEVTAFMGMIIEYLFLTEKLDAARSHLKLLKDINPDHPITRHAQRLLRKSAPLALLAKAMRRLAK